MTLPSAGYFTNPTRTNGEAKQAQDDMLDTLIALPAAVGDVTGPASSTSGNLATFSGTGGKTISDSGIAPGTLLRTTNNLSDIASASSARGNLGLGSAATANTGTSAGNVVVLDGSGRMPAVDGSQLTGIGGADQTARDQLALTNLRLLLAGSVSSGALMSGYQWELGTDEWATGSTNYTFTSATPNYYTSSAGGTVATSRTATGATNGGFTLVDETFSVTNSRTVNSIGVYSTVAATIKVKLLKQNSAGNYDVVVDQSFSHGGGGWQDCTLSSPYTVPGSGTYYLGSYSASHTSVDGGMTSQSAYANADVTGTGQALTEAGGVNVQVRPMRYTWVTASDMTLLSPAVSVSAAPTAMAAYFLHKDSSGSAVLGTDLTVDLSRDGGTTWTASTLTTVAAYDGTYSAIKARADVSSQPSGTSMKARIKTLNNKVQRVAAPAIYKE